MQFDEYKQLTPEIANFFDWIFSVYKENGIDYADIGRWRAYGRNRLYDYRQIFPMKGSCLIFTKTFGQMELLGYTNYGYWHNLTNNSQKLQNWNAAKLAQASAFTALKNELQLEELPVMKIDPMFGATEDNVRPFYIANQAYHFPLVSY